MPDIKKAFDSFAGKKILVVGDVMIDTYINGSVNRISPEAPVPVVRFKSREHRLGGAANVALNLKSLSADPIICSVIGKDDEAANFMKLVKDSGMNADGMISSAGRTTTVKTRVIGNHQQLLRVDQEQIEPLSPNDEKNLISKIEQLCNAGDVKAIIFEDYNKGVLTEGLIRAVISFANKNGIFTAADPKKDNFLAYQNVTLFKPNLKELNEGTGIQVEGAYQEGISAAALELNGKINATYLLITLSEHGVFMYAPSDKYFIPAHRRNIADVSGAGDTVISVATLCLISGLNPEISAAIANLAGGLVCEQVGVVPVDPVKLLKEALALK